jgi:hypothetical protein
MGTKRPDMIPLADWRPGAETVDKMQSAGWDVFTQCRACGLKMAADLALIAKVSGGATSLWNRKARCRRLGCSGFVDFWGKPPQRSRHEPLSAPWPDGVPPRAP